MGELVRCSFYWRRALPEESEGIVIRGLTRWRYSQIFPDHAGPHGEHLLAHPPTFGDLVWLSGTVEDLDDGERAIEVAGAFKVVKRQWSFTSHGSPDWPYNELRPLTPYSSWLSLMVIEDESMFADEAPLERRDD